MKKYSTLLLLLLPFLLNAQITWERPYGNVTHLSINDIIEGPNNSFISVVMTLQIQLPEHCLPNSTVQEIHYGKNIIPFKILITNLTISCF